MTLIDKGILNQQALLDNRITLKELLVELRISGLTSISEAQYVFLEPNGKFSIIPKAPFRQATNADLNLKVPEDTPDISLIVDGKINRSGLNYLSKTENWLKKEISPHSPHDILLFSGSISGKYTLILKDNAK